MSFVLKVFTFTECELLAQCSIYPCVCSNTKVFQKIHSTPRTKILKFTTEIYYNKVSDILADISHQR